MSTDQNPTLTPKPVLQPGAAEPLCLLVVLCIECGQGVEVPLPTDRNTITLQLAKHGWFMSVLTPPSQGPAVPIVVGAICASCAATVYPPEVMKVAEERRLKMLATAEPTPPTQTEASR